MATVLSLLVLAGVAMLLGAWAQQRRGASRKQVLLMLLLAAVIAGNVALLVVPDSSGKSPAEQAGKQKPD